MISLKATNGKRVGGGGGLRPQTNIGFGNGEIGFGKGEIGMGRIKPSIKCAECIVKYINIHE